MLRLGYVLGDFYFTAEGYVVWTEAYHLKRGYCCNSKCRHCPYGNAPGPNPEIARIDLGALPGAIPLIPILKPKGNT